MDIPVDIPMVAITGGPCSGKTTSMAFLAEKLSDFGRKVFIVPEAATIFIKSGFDPRVYYDEDQILRIQEAIFNIQLNHEEQWLDTARISDKAIQNCWLGHPHLRIMDNSTGFEQKIKRTLAAICRFLDIPTPIEIERKFLVSEVDTKRLLEQSQKIKIKQFYLRSENGEEVRLRERTYYGSSSYFLTTKKKTDNPAIRQEVERIISLRDALFLEKNRDYHKYPIVKERHCFLHKNQYFELDFFNHPIDLKNVIILEIELTEENDRIDIPDWIKIKREVTGDPTYSNFNLAGPYNASTKFD